MRVRHFFYLVISTVLIGSCASRPPTIPPPQISLKDMSQGIREKEISAPTTEKKPARVRAKGAESPWREDHPDLREPVSISAFNLPLGHVLQSLIEPTRLNLEIKENVNLEKPVTVRATGSSLGRVLLAVLSPSGYSFKVKGETLFIFETDTRTFRLSIPGLVQDYNSTITNQSTTSVGRSDGGGIGTETTSTTTGQSGTQSQNFAVATLGSEVTLTTKIEQADIWKIIGENLKSMVIPPGRYSLDRIAGRITVTAKAPVLENVARYVEQLEEEYSRQARFDVQLLEVSVTDQNQFGVDWTKVWNSLIQHNAVTIAANNAFTQGLGASIPSFTLSSRSGASEIVISALKEQGKVRLLSQPKILVRNNMVAVLSIGEIIPFISSVSQTVSNGSVTTSPTISSVQAGVVLSITPKINADRTMTIHLSPIVSRVTSFENFTVGTTSFRAPRLDTRNLSSVVNVKDGETIVLGGLITQDEQKDRQSVPILGDIPFLGALASTWFNSEKRSELVIVLTPKIETSKTIP